MKSQAINPFTQRIVTGIPQLNRGKIAEEVSFRILNAIEPLQHKKYRKSVEAHIPNLPEISEAQMEIVNAIRDKGYYLTSLDEFSKIIPQSKALLADIPRLSNVLKLGMQLENEKRSCTREPRIHTFRPKDDFMDAFTEWESWGLHPKILEIMEHLKLQPTAFDGASVRWTLGKKGGGSMGPQTNEHMDFESTRLEMFEVNGKMVPAFGSVKIFVYLTDVNEDSGAFQIKNQPPTADPFLSWGEPQYYLHKPIKSDGKNYKTITAKAGDILIAQTVGPHRQKPAAERAERGVVCLGYFPAVPRNPQCSQSTSSYQRKQEIVNRAYEYILRNDSYRNEDPELLKKKLQDAVLWKDNLPLTAKAFARILQIPVGSHT